MFGPRDTHFVAQLVAKAREGDITHLIGDGRNVVDFTYVENAVYAHLLAAARLGQRGFHHDGRCYFITNGEPRPFWSFIKTVLSETGCVGPTKSISFRVAYTFAWVMEIMQWLLARLGVPYRPTITRSMVCAMGRDHWFSHANATADFGYRPRVSLEDGLEQTVAFFVQSVRTGDFSDGAV